MRVVVAAIGKFKASHEREIFQSYIKRIPWHFELKELEAKKSLSGNQLKDAEASMLLEAIPKGSRVIALDERGKNISSTELAELFSRWQGMGCSSVGFVIGGADGLSDHARSQADFILSFGKLTWPHILVRVMLAEQIYRTFSIISNHPYHRE